MKVHVQFFSRLKDIVGASDLEMEIAEGASAADLLSTLYGQHPRLRAWNNSLLIGAGVEFVERDYILQPRETIALMPPVQGG